MKSTGLGKVITDNDKYYLEFLELIVFYSDPDAIVSVDKSEKNIKTKITPSKEEYKSDIINNILLIHKHFKMKLDFSKSTKIQKNIYYTIGLV